MASIYGGNTIKNEMMSLLKKGEIFEQLNNNYKNTKNCKYICKHEFSNTICRHKNMNKCTFAHSIRDLDDIFKEKILSLGIEAYHYLYHIEKEQYNNRYNNNISLIQYIEQLKTNSNHYSNKLKELDLEKKRINNELSDIKHYNKLLVKKKNIFNFETNLSKVSISSLLKQYNQKYKNSEFDLFKNQSLMNAIEKLNDLSYCFVCYNNIIDLDDIDNPKNSCCDENQKNNNYFVSLSCGHSICYECHKSLIIANETFNIKCPKCRELIEIKDVKPNYKLNDLIKYWRYIVLELLQSIDNFNFEFDKKLKNKFITSKKQSKIKSWESPW